LALNLKPKFKRQIRAFIQPITLSSEHADPLSNDELLIINTPLVKRARNSRQEKVIQDQLHELELEEEEKLLIVIIK
jgi:hypothetical protein